MQVKKKQNQTYNNRLVPNWKRSTARPHIVILLILLLSCEMPGWMKQRLKSRLLGEISITSDMQMTPPLWQKVKNNKRASWWKWKRRVKIWLKACIQKTKIMASSHITSWQTDGETMKTVKDFISGGSKITADGDCTMKLKGAYSLEEKLWPT